MQEVHNQETAQILKLYLFDKEYEDPGFAGRNFFAARFSCGFFLCPRSADRHNSRTDGNGLWRGLYLYISVVKTTSGFPQRDSRRFKKRTV